MGLFDPNQWYHIYVNEDDNYAMKGITYDQGTNGATYFESAELDKPWLQWQIRDMTNSDYYVLRTKDAQLGSFMVAQFAPQSDLEGQTLATMRMGNLSDDSVYWQVKPWGDGTFFMSNKRNGTEWHLSVNGTETVL